LKNANRNIDLEKRTYIQGKKISKSGYR